MEVYGTARINGQPKWNIQRGRAVKKECGNTIQILNNYVTNDSNFLLNLDLMDRDSGSRDDRVGRFSISSKIYNTRRTYRWRSGEGEASKLNIIVKPLSQTKKEIRISDGNEKIIKKNGDFWVNGQFLGNGEWITPTRYVVFVKQWGNRWWVGELSRQGMLSTTVLSQRETLSVKPSHLERYVSE